MSLAEWFLVEEVLNFNVVLLAEDSLEQLLEVVLTHDFVREGLEASLSNGPDLLRCVAEVDCEVGE